MSLARICSGSLVAAVLSGCAVPSAPPQNRRPIRWIMVEKRLGDLLPEGLVGDGRADLESALLALEPLDAEDVSWEVQVDPHDYGVEVLEILPSPRAAPGETVTATVRVGRARTGELYRLIARAMRGDVELLGPSENTVQGSAPASFRFTSSSLGRGGIAIDVQRVEAPGR